MPVKSEVPGVPTELNIVLEVLDDAADQLRWLADPQFHAYSQEQRVRLEVLTAQMDALRSELETAPTSPRWLCVGCDNCGRVTRIAGVHPENRR